MAGRSDGSIIIDTKLDNSGFGKGSKEMQSAVDSLHKQVDNLGKRVDSVMSGMGQAAQAASKQVNAMGSSARSASRDVDKLQESVNRAGAGKRINPIKFDQDAIRRAQKEMASLDKWGTGTNEKNLGARFTDLEKTLGRLSAKSAKLDISNPESVKAFRAEIDETEQTIRQMAADLLKVGNTKIPTAQFSALTQQVKEAEDHYNTLVDKWNEMKSAGQLGRGAATGLLKRQIDQARESVEALQQQYHDMLSTGEAYSTPMQDMPRLFDSYSQSLEVYKSELDSLGSATSEAFSPAGAEEGASRVSGLAGMIEQAMFRAANSAVSFGAAVSQAVHHPVQTLASAGTGAAKALGSLARSALSAGKALAVMAGSSMAKGIRSIASSAADAAKNMLGLNKSVSSSGSPLKASLWNMIRYGLGIRSVFALVNRLRGAVRDGFGNLAQYSAPVNNAISSVMGSLTMLKNSLATAFAPIFTAIAPAINYLCGLLSTAMSYIAQFMSALTGGKTFYKATKAVNNYAGSMAGAGSAGEAAGKSAKEASKQLAAFDKLNVLTDDSKNNGGGAGGGGGVGGMFETLPIDSSIADFVKHIKDAFKKGDYEEVGRIIAEGINTAVQKIKDFIKWENVRGFWEHWIDAFTRIFNSLVKNINWYEIGAMFGEGFNTLLHILDLLLTKIDWKLLGRSIGKALNGLVDTIDWKLLGKTFADSFNAKLDLLYGAVTEFDWVNLGSKIAESINSAIENINWEEIGSTISESAKGVLETFFTAVDEIDWYQLGQNVAKAIENIDWAGIIGDAFHAAGSITGAIAAFIGGLISDAVEEAKEYFDEKIEECGGNVFEGILTGILDAAKNIVTWIKDHVFTPFLDGFKNAFGISSPADETKPIGKYIIEGILEGMLDKVKNIGKWIDRHVKKPIKRALTKMFSGATEKLQVAVSLIKSGWTTIKNFVGTAVSVAVSLAKKGWSKISSFVGSAVSVAVSLAKKGWSAISSFVGTAVSVTVSLAKKGWSKISAYVGTAVTVSISLAKSGWSAIKNFVGTAVTVAISLAKKGWTKISTYVGTAVTVSISLAKKGWTKISTYVGTAVTVTISLAKKGWSKISAYVGTAVTVAISLARKGWEKISKFIGTAVTVSISLARKGWVGTAVTVAISLSRNKWTSIKSFVGTAVSVGISLFKDGWSSIAKFVGTSVSVGISLFKSGWSSIKSFFGLADGGIIGANGSVQAFSSGGMIRGGRATWWDGVQKYAGGTSRAHGTAFIAGESGPEIVGHVNGRTEVLNKSQIASAIHSAVLSAMSEAANAFAAFLGQKLAECANGVISAIYAASYVSVPIPVSLRVSDIDLGRYAGILDDLRGLGSANYVTPAISTGTVMPYSVAAQSMALDRVTDSIEASNDELGQVIVSAISSAALAVVDAIRRGGGQTGMIDLDGLTQRTIDDINRRTIMYNARPIK